MRKKIFLNLKIPIAGILLLFMFYSCDKEDNSFDASGSFEADETIISSQASGVIREFNIEEGNVLDSGTYIGYVDSTPLYLKKLQLIAQLNALESRKPDITIQLAALQEQLKNAQKDRERISNLLQSDAATQKQLDDITTRTGVLEKQIEAQNSTLTKTRDGIEKEALSLKLEVEQVNNQLAKCRIVCPMRGTVITRYAEVNESTSPGKALYKIANLSSIILRVYISGDQLPMVRLNQQVVVSTDNGKGGFNETKGRITWISDKAEFTPKTIQTKNDRANMVYAIKVNVKNDGTYKIGMYGEIRFTKVK